jgi:hypothetical protein
MEARDDLQSIRRPAKDLLNVRKFLINVIARHFRQMLREIILR